MEAQKQAVRKFWHSILHRKMPLADTKYQALDEGAPPPKINRPTTFRFIVINALIFSAYVGAFIYILKSPSSQRQSLIFSPAQSAVSYETRVIDTSIHTPLREAPGSNADTAWGQLLQYNNVVVSADDLKKINGTSVQLRDKSGYLGTLDVFHELHCLNYVREYVFSDFYQLEHEHKAHEHIFHCIDHLRAILMCHGDVSLHTFEWLPTAHYPVLKPRTTHQCRKWEPIVQWAKDHFPSHEHGPILEHPKYGIIQPTKVNNTQA